MLFCQSLAWDPNHTLKYKETANAGHRFHENETTSQEKQNRMELIQGLYLGNKSFKGSDFVPPISKTIMRRGHKNDMRDITWGKNQMQFYTDSGMTAGNKQIQTRNLDQKCQSNGFKNFRKF